MNEGNHGNSEKVDLPGSNDQQLMNICTVVDKEVRSHVIRLGL